MDNCFQLSSKVFVFRKLIRPTDDLHIGRTQTTSQNIFTLTGGGTETIQKTVQETLMIMESLVIQYFIRIEFVICLKVVFYYLMN